MENGSSSAPFPVMSSWGLAFDSAGNLYAADGGAPNDL